jgi:two-component system cell cycle sensor histidine kinase PleC
MRAYETIVAAIRRTMGNVSPVTVAVAITALSAAGLFTVTDIARTVGENDGELQIVEAVMKEIGTSHIAPAALTTMPIAAKPLPLDSIDGEAVSGLLQRSGWAFVAAFLMIAVAWRRKPQLTPADGIAARHPELDSMLATVQEQQRVLARRYYEEKLKAQLANNSKIAFLSHLSHDIRTPLNHIIGFADLMRQETYGPLGDTRYANYVDTIKGSGERLLTFFASILELAEFESGEKALRRDTLITDEVIRTATRRFRAPASPSPPAPRPAPP